MYKRLSSVVFFLLGTAAMPSSGGCHAVADSLCDEACADYNALNCATTCNCGACAEAPIACDSYYDCIKAYSGGCVELAVTCTIPSDCQSFINENCQ
jgi:hypothetical protein